MTVKRDPLKSPVCYVTALQLFFLCSEESEIRMQDCTLISAPDGDIPNSLFKVSMWPTVWPRGLESRDGMNNTSDRASNQQLTWLPSGTTRNKVDISGSLPPEASFAHFWDLQTHWETDTQGQAGGSWAELLEAGWSCRTWAVFLPPHPHLPTHHILTHMVERKSSFGYLIFGKPPGDRNLVLRTPPSLPLLGTDTHTQAHTHTALHHGGPGCSGSE